MFMRRIYIDMLYRLHYHYLRDQIDVAWMPSRSYRKGGGGGGMSLINLERDTVKGIDPLPYFFKLWEISYINTSFMDWGFMDIIPSGGIHIEMLLVNIGRMYFDLLSIQPVYVELFGHVVGHTKHMAQKACNLNMTFKLEPCKTMHTVPVTWTEERNSLAGAGIVFQVFFRSIKFR